MSFCGNNMEESNHVMYNENREVYLMNRGLSAQIDRRLEETSEYISLKLLGDHSEQEKKEILTYGIIVFMKETGKLCMLCLLFLFMGYFKEFVFAVVNFLMLRTFIGGMHRKTTIGCLIQSFLTIYLCILISRMELLSGVLPVIIGAVLIVLVILLAPVVAKERAKYPKGKRIQFKIAAVIMIAIQLLLENYLPHEYANMMTSCELLVLAELAAAVTVRYKEGKMQTTDHCP